MREVWLLFNERPEARSQYARGVADSLAPLLEQEMKPVDDGSDRLALHGFLADLRLLLDEMWFRSERLVDYETRDDLREAWGFIERQGNFDQALRIVLDPPADYDLAGVGLVGAPRELKVGGFRRALQRLFDIVGEWTWPDVKPVLRWANVLLGSLAKVIPVVDPIKEFKESWEAAAEEAYE